MQTKEKLNGVNGKYSKKINKKENQNHHGRDLLEKLTKMVRIYLRHHQNCMYVCIWDTTEMVHIYLKTPTKRYILIESTQNGMYPIETPPKGNIFKLLVCYEHA